MTTRTRDPARRLATEIRRMRRDRLPLDMEPSSAYEAVTRQMVEGLRDELREIRGRINGLIFLLIGAVVLEVLMRLMRMA